MGAAEQLNSFRTAVPGCRIATFADLSSGLVLFTSPDTRVPQERLDALCDAARKLLLNDLPSGLATALGSEVMSAIVPEDDDLLVFVRSANDPCEAILCDCSANVDVHAVVSGAAAALAALD